MNAEIDTVLMLHTPERVQIPLRLAGFSSRGLAWLLDFIIRTTAYIILLITSAIIGLKSIGALHFLILFSMEWLYPVFFEIFSMGQTPGKKALGIKVIREDGSPLELSSSLIRNFLRVIDIVPFFYGVGMVSCLMDRKFRRLGDLAARTLVIYKEASTAKARNPSSLQESHALPNVAITPDERKALLSFQERGATLSSQRREELAELLQDLHGQRGALASQSVNAYASHLRGQG